MTPSPPLLSMTSVTKRFGGLTAVADVSATHHQGELGGLIGPPGAGKTTVFNLVTGVYQPSEGAIAVLGASTTGLTPDRITALGVARTFQNIRLFGEMTVLENVKTAFNLKLRYGMASALLRTRAFKAEEARVERESLDLLSLFNLADLASERSTSLPYGEQRRLEIARALATGPRLLILDEPAAGMNPNETEALMAMLHDIKARFDLTLLLIEHDMKFVMQMCERIIVLDYGRVIARGTPEEVRSNPDVITAYLGDSADGIEL